MTKSLHMLSLLKLTTAMVVEELGVGDLGTSVVMAQTLKLAQIMEKALNDDQKQRSLVPFSEDPRGVLAIGITEPICDLIIAIQ